MFEIATRGMVFGRFAVRIRDGRRHGEAWAGRWMPPGTTSRAMRNRAGIRDRLALSAARTRRGQSGQLSG